jgi:hypothetical protein
MAVKLDSFKVVVSKDDAGDIRPTDILRLFAQRNEPFKPFFRADGRETLFYKPGRLHVLERDAADSSNTNSFHHCRLLLIMSLNQTSLGTESM